MHDIHLANQIVKLAKENAKKHNIKDIKKIKVALGYVSEHGEVVHPENLEFNIKLLLSDVAVEIDRIDDDRWELIEIDGD
ncbi:hydrogenase/urease maturation nickel metallochaperone HypA [Patescibacteria group bacterium]